MSVRTRPGQCGQSLASHFNLSGAFRSFGTCLLALGILGLTACGDPPASPPPAKEAPADPPPVAQPSSPRRDPISPLACAPYSISEGPVDLFERVTLVGLTSPEDIDGIRIEGPESDLPVFLGQAEDSSFFFKPSQL